jgi:DNA-binding GntR family transcriptional regulator
VARAADDAYEALREAILTGRHAAGGRLGEVELAAEVGVSRTPVREALRRLAAEGLVEVLPNRGARVSSWTAQDLEELYELRALLEGHGAGLAAPRATAEDVARLRSLAEAMDAVGRPGRRQDLDRLAELNQVFHGHVLQVAGNARLVALMQSVVQVPLVLRTFHRYDGPALARSLRHHHELVAAIETRDGSWAASVMRSHVLAARAVLVAAARREDAPVPGEEGA